MDIKIGEYQIASDAMNVLLNKQYEKTTKTGDPTGEIGYKTIGYYRNLEDACTAMIDKEIMISDAENLSELVEIIANVKKEIKAAVKEISVK